MRPALFRCIQAAKSSMATALVGAETERTLVSTRYTAQNSVSRSLSWRAGKSVGLKSASASKRPNDGTRDSRSHSSKLNRNRRGLAVPSDDRGFAVAGLIDNRR
jgi:hypothetical protein